MRKAYDRELKEDPNEAIFVELSLHQVSGAVMALVETGNAKRIMEVGQIALDRIEVWTISIRRCTLIVV